MKNISTSSRPQSFFYFLAVGILIMHIPGFPSVIRTSVTVLLALVIIFLTYQVFSNKKVAQVNHAAPAMNPEEKTKDIKKHKESVVVSNEAIEEASVVAPAEVPTETPNEELAEAKAETQNV
jgi:type III secretory pathway component EscV